MYIRISASGKDYATKILSNKYKLNRIVQFTTRPMRGNEKDGVDYNFINKDSFEKMISEDYFVSFRVFKSLTSDWYYGISRESMNVSQNSIICIDMEGLTELLEKYNKHNIISVFIDADYATRRERADKRSSFNIDEFNRRYKDDLNKIDKIKSKCDYIVDNNRFGNCANMLSAILEKRLKL